MSAGNQRVDDRFRLARLARGLSQGALADIAGVTRQSISGIESGRWSPSLEVALALAAALGARVEDLFGAAPELPPIDAPRRPRPAACTGARLGDRWHSGRLSPYGRPWLRRRLPAPLGYTTGTHQASASSIIQTKPLAASRPTLAIAGCDPALALLAGPLDRHRPPNSLVWWACSNAAARRLLKTGTVHAAAVHGAPTSGHAAHRGTRRSASQAGARASSSPRDTPKWSTGSPTPSSSASVSSTVSRALEARRLLDDALAEVGAQPSSLSGYETACTAHLLVASAIAAGLADVGVASQPAAIAYGLGFVAWQEEICELHVPRSLLGTPEIRALLDVLAGSELPAQLAAIAGYDPRPCGKLSGA